MIKAIIFDFDGVLFNTEKPVFKMLKKLLKKYGLKFKTDKELEDMWRLNFYDSMEKRGIKGKKLEKFKDECEGELRKMHMQIFQHIPPILKELSRHYYLAVVSSNFKKILTSNLKKKELLGYFSAVVGADIIEEKTKRIEKCLDIFKIKPSEAVYVGDTTGDVKEAKKVKVKTLAVTWGFHSRALLKKEKPTYIISRPKQMLKLFDIKLPKK